MDILGIRSQIPATRHAIYMNTGWSGPSPEPVVRRIQEVLGREAEGPATPAFVEEQRRIFESARRAVAHLVHAAFEEVVLTQNTTEGLNIVVNGLPWQEGDEAVTCSLEHPSVLVPLLVLGRRRGVRVRVVDLAPAYGGPADALSKLEAALSERTRLVALSHVQYSSGLRLPIREIASLAHQRGARLLVDGAQAVGQMPVDMKGLGCDFYAMPGQKWLLGPDGVGALYVRRELIPELEPCAVSPHAARRWDPQGALEVEREAITKFMLSAQSAPLAAGLEAAIAFVQGVGLDAIWRRTLSLAGTLKKALADIPGCGVLTPLGEDASAGLVSFTLAGWEPRAVAAALWERWRIAGRAVQHPPCVRVCTAFFNTEEEVGQAARAVQTLAGERA